ncbi:winged helix-turn-helix transcriptional regulator, partial [Streptomyces asiaticus]
MTRSRAQDTNVCGVTAAISVIDGKWKTALLWALESGPYRPGELRRWLPGLSEKVLTQSARTAARRGAPDRGPAEHAAQRDRGLPADPR